MTTPIRHDTFHEKTLKIIVEFARTPQDLTVGATIRYILERIYFEDAFKDDIPHFKQHLIIIHISIT